MSYQPGAKRRSKYKPDAPGDPLVPAQVQYVNEFHPQAVAITQMAALILLKYRLFLFQRGPKPTPDETASGLISTFLDMVRDTQYPDRGKQWWVEHDAMCRLALDMAQADSRYVGVVRFKDERSCSGCNRVKPMDSFNEGRFLCKECEC